MSSCISFSLPHCVCVCVCTHLYTCIYIHTLFFLNHLRVSCIHNSPLLSKTSLFPMNKNVIIRNYSTVIKIRNSIPLSSRHIPVSLIVPTMSFIGISPFGSGSHFEFSSHVSLVSFSPNQLFSSSLSFLVLTFF